jgi:hypothetical protein
MKTNLGNLDRAIRMVAALVVASMYYAEIISGSLAIFLLIVAGILTLTGITGFSPMYRAFGLSSLRKTPKKS